jgi:general secretion pathway protein N
MVRCPKIIGLALLVSGILLTCPAGDLHAATSSTLDILSDDRLGAASDTVEIGTVKPLGSTNREGELLPSGNPLWAVPLWVLTATQERPIFSASRRPPQRAVIAPPLNQVNVPAPQVTAEPELPALTLIGAVVGDSDAIAVFLDRTNQKIVRLRQGETHAGWVLSSVLRREVTLRKADRSEVLGLQRQDGPAVVPRAAGVPGLVVPEAGGAEASYNSSPPFVYRKPKRERSGDEVVCRGKAQFLRGCESLPARVAPAGSNRSRR